MRRIAWGVLLSLLAWGLAGCFGTSSRTATCTLTITKEGQGTVKPASGAKFSKATVVHLEPVPDLGWAFGHWEGPDASSVTQDDHGYRIVLDRDRCLCAVFSKLQYPVTVSLDPVGAGQVEVLVESSLPWDRVKLTAHALELYAFDHWEGALSGPANPATLIMDSPKSVTAVFKQAADSVSGRVTAPIGGQGVAGVQISFDDGTSPTFTDQNGRWNKSGLRGPVNVRPAKDGWTFSPQTCAASPSTSNDFVGANPIVFDLNDPYLGAVRDIFIMNPDGSSITNLTNGLGMNMTPTLSPDRKRIAFSSTRDGLGWDLCVMNIDGTGYRNLTPTDGPIELHPTWSPTGEQIVYERQDLYGGSSSGRLWMVGADGASPHKVTSQFFDQENEPSWSPTQPKIAFSAYRSGTRHYEIYVMNTDGTQVTRVTDGGGFCPRYSPDGSKIVYMVHMPTTPVSQYDIWVMNADGTGQTQLTHNTGDKLWPCWSPDGSKILFAYSPYGPDLSLCTMDPDGTGWTVITGGPGRRYPAW